MLNNDFKVLVEKYNRYKKQKKKSRNRKILLLILLTIIGYYLSTMLSFDFQKERESKQNDNVTIEQNATIDTQSDNQEVNASEKAITQDDNQPKVNELRLQVTTKEKSLEQLTANQAKSKSYSSTISLANYHYSKKEYESAIKWAIEASKLNKSKERPWIVYAKSKIALGKEEIAKKALELYLKKNQSKEAQALLDTLK